MRRARFALQLLIVAGAAALAALPLPPAGVERYFARAWYPAVQAAVTAWSNTTAYSLFDILVAVAAAALLVMWGRSMHAAWRRRSVRPVASAVITTAVGAAVLYLWFALAWGLNYARPPLEAALGFDAARVTPHALAALAGRSAREINAGYARAHAEGFPAVHDVPPALVAALHDVERRLGRPRGTVPGRPKRTLLAPFFRASGVDGMHAPFLLETLVNPDLTPVERPAVLAHEWAHLSGFAPEDDASFVGLLAALSADAPSQYSAWLAIFDYAASQLPLREQQRLVAELGPGPQADRRAIAARLASRVDAIARASWQTYDQYLKAQGVDEGVRSYSRVIQLLLGSGAIDRL